MAADCSRSVAVASWHLILENASTINDGGRIDIPSRRIAAALCEPLTVIEALVSAFQVIGLLTDSHVAAWKRRQYDGDNSTERSRRHRAKKKAETLPLDDGATLQQRPATPPETETETYIPLAIANGPASPASLSASDITKAIFDTGVRLIVQSGRLEREARSVIGRWRKTYTDSQVLTAISRCERAEDISDPLEWITKALQSENKNGRQAYRPTGDSGDRRSNLARAIDEGLDWLGGGAQA
jgi:hypothetical protein